MPALREAVDKDPSNPTYQYHLGLAYAKTGARQKAKEALQRALAIKADFSGAEEAMAGGRHRSVSASPFRAVAIDRVIRIARGVASSSPA